MQAVAETPVTETPEVTEPEEKVEKEAAVEEKPAPDAAEESEEPENLRKIFAGGLNRDTSDEKFKEFFSQFGNITDGVVIKDQGQSELSTSVLVPSSRLLLRIFVFTACCDRKTCATEYNAVHFTNNPCGIIC